MHEFYANLKPYVYENAKEAANVTIKNFMRTHVRYFAPGHYKKLILDQPAIKKWISIEYLKEKIGEQFIYGVHYYNNPPFHLYAHDIIFTN